MLILAVGDVHGCYDKLVSLLTQCRKYADGRPHRFIFIGDYIDRGPNSRAVIDLLIGLQSTADPAPIFVATTNRCSSRRFKALLPSSIGF